MALIVIDTSVFTNSGSYKAFGKTPTQALKSFLQSSDDFRVYTPPGCWKELLGFLELTEISRALLLKITIKAPDRTTVNVPGHIVYDMVCDVRNRSEAALKFATGMLRETYKAEPQKKEKGQPDPETPYIERLRKGVRHHTREGFVDSGADLDVILLAKELGAKIMTSDQGLAAWADKFGVERLPCELFV